MMRLLRLALAAIVLAAFTSGAEAQTSCGFAAGTQTISAALGACGTAKQNVDAELTGLAGLSGTGYVVQTGAGTFTNRSISSTSGDGISITAGNGVASNTNIALSFTDKGADASLNADACNFTSNATVAGNIVCEGDTLDTIETRIVITDPTASDKSFTIPNANSFASQDNSCTGTDKVSAIASGVGSCSADDDVPDAGEVSDTALAAGAVDGGAGGEIADGSITVDDLNTTGAADEECLTYEGTGPAIEWQSCGGAGASPGGATGDVQYNDGASGFAGESAFDYDATGDLLTAPSLIVTEDVALTGDISPAQITANQNDYNPTGLSAASVIKLSTDNDARAITGLAGGSDGRVLFLMNNGSYDLLLNDQDTASTAANRFEAGGNDTVVPAQGTVELLYNATSSRWHVGSVTGDDATRAGTRRQPWFFTEWLTVATTASPPFTGAAISSGTAAINTTNIANDHPGVVRITSSTTANSGYRWQTDTNSILIGGGESYELVFNPLATTNTTVRMGFHDTTANNAVPIDGVWIEYVASTTLNCRTSSNSTASTAAIATISTATWYRAVIKIDRTAANATCSLYNANGVSLGSQTMNANIPTGAGRNVQVGVVAGNSGTTATALVDLDYMAARFGEGRPLLR